MMLNLQGPSNIEALSCTAYRAPKTTIQEIKTVKKIKIKILQDTYLGSVGTSTVPRYIE
jgi:hypothetical protein